MVPQILHRGPRSLPQVTSRVVTSIKLPFLENISFSVSPLKSSTNISLQRESRIVPALPPPFSLISHNFLTSARLVFRILVFIDYSIGSCSVALF